jgi:putative membrane protein
MPSDFATNSLDAGEMMGSDDKPEKEQDAINDGPTLRIPVPETGPEMPTEEAERPTAVEFDDSPTRIRPISAPLAVPIPDPNDPGPDPTVGQFLENEAPEQTIGIFLKPEVPTAEETIGMLLKADSPQHEPTIGIFLEDAPPTAEHTLDEMLNPVRIAPSETIGQYMEPIDAPEPSIHEAETILTPDTPWKGLHPVSLAVNLLPRAWQTIRSMWPILLFVLIGGEGAGMRFIDLFVILLFTLMSIWNTFIHWITLRYRLHQGRLEIASGLMNRQARTIDPTRIQNVELVQNLFHKWSGLVELRIDTAGEQSTEGLLSALSVEEATTLRNQLAAVGSLAAAGRSEEDNGDTIATMGIAEILAYGLTQRTIGTVAVITAVGLEVLTQAGPDVAAEFTGSMQPTMVVAAFMLAFVASWAVSALTSIFRFFGYQMTRFQSAIRTEYGLTTRRKVEIPLSKVQLVRADEPLMRRLMGYGTLLIETAGLGVIEGQVRQAEGVVPMVEYPDLGRVAATAVPHIDIDPWNTPLRPAHPRALYRAIVGASIRALILMGIGLAYLDDMAWIVLFILPIAWVGAWLDWKKQGWLVTPTAIVSRRGFFNRRTFILSRNKLQSVHIVQGPFMRLHGLSRLVIRVAGSQIRLPETGSDDTDWLYSELSA